MPRCAPRAPAATPVITDLARPARGLRPATRSPTGHPVTEPAGTM